MAPVLTIDVQPAGRNGSATLTAKLGEEVLHVEKLDLTKPKARQAFADSLCDGRPGIDRAEVEAKLLRLAADLAERNGKDGDVAKSDNESPDGDDEIDASRIVRPERFVTQDVSGFAVPVLAEIGGKPTGLWSLYLCWTDGRRQRISLPTAIALPDDGRLWVHPRLPEPSPSDARALCGWSQTARCEWLKWGVAADPADLFKRLCRRVAYFLDFPKRYGPGLTAMVALWVILSYVYPAWDAVPYLYIGGPLGSGKSRLFEILTRLVFRPLGSSNMTGPALFRTLHNRGGVLLLDEAERLKQTQNPDVGEILSMLLAGYKRGGQATRLEPVGDTFKTVTFDVYGPKALACIAGLPPALLSRCITVMMFRAPPDSRKPRQRIDADAAGWQDLRDDLHALALNHGPTWLELAEKTNVCPAMSGRDFELWQPILALAEWIESHGATGLVEVVKQHALETIDANKDDQAPDHDEVLLRALADEIRMGRAPTAGDILAKARTVEADSFTRWTARGVGGHLRRYGMRTMKSGGQRVYREVTLDDLRGIQAAYGIDLGFQDAEETK